MFGMGEEFLSSPVFQELAVSLAGAFERFFKVERDRGQSRGEIKGEEKGEIDECYEELMANPGLLKVGCEPSDGSDSEPSVCNLQFDKINKMVLQSQPRPSTVISAKKKVVVRPQSSIKTSMFRKQQGLSVGLSR